MPRASRSGSIFPSSWAGVVQYVENIRQQLRTRWTYCVFFTKYPVWHFAYASVPRIVMQYSNDGWGPDNSKTETADAAEADGWGPSVPVDLRSDQPHSPNNQSLGTNTDSGFSHH